MVGNTIIIIMLVPILFQVIVLGIKMDKLKKEMIDKLETYQNESGHKVAKFFRGIR